MENIVKEVLVKQLHELHEQSDKLQNEFSKEIHERCLKYYKGLGKEFGIIHHIAIHSREIQVFFSDSFSDYFGIRRDESYDYKEQKTIYSEPKLNIGSFKEESEKCLNELVLIGELAKLKLNKHRYWNSTVDFMNEFSNHQKTVMKPIWNKCHELENAIKTLEKEEDETKVFKLLGKGSMVFKNDEKGDTVKFQTGPGKRDWVWVKNLYWVNNPGGKTYEVGEMVPERKFNEEKDEWENSGELEKVVLKARMKAEDLLQFIRYKIDKVIN